MTFRPQPNDLVRIRLRRDSKFYDEATAPHWLWQEYGVDEDATYLVRFVDRDCVYINVIPLNSAHLMESRPLYGISALNREDYEFTSANR
jgi:hypothetical protein